MNYLENNMQAMKEHRTALYYKLKEFIDEEKYDISNMTSVEARDGNSVFCVEKEGKTYRLNSAFRPFDEAKRWADQFEYQNLNVVVMMFGIGNGIFLREIISRLGDDSRVFLVEPDLSIFIYQMINQDLSDIIGNENILIFLSEISDSEFKDAMYLSVHWSMLSTKIVCAHPGYDKLYPEQNVEFLREISYVSSLLIVDKNTTAYMSKRIVTNVLKNLRYIKDSNCIMDFMDSFDKDIPVIIVSSGPSLQKNIDFLNDAYGKAVIICVDSAVKYLVKNNIKFDAIVTIDARKAMGHIVKYPEIKNVPLFCAMESSDRIMEFMEGKKIWLRSDIYIDKIYKELGKVFPPYHVGGSVATAATSLALSLGFEKIVLLGQDLAYDGEYSHAGEVRDKKTREGIELVEVDGINGDKVFSRGDWILYRDWFEKIIADTPDIELIDATEGGALIHGSTVMKFSEVIDKYCNKEVDITGILRNQPPTFTEKEYEKVKKYCLNMTTEFAEIRKKSKEGIEAADDLLKMIAKKEYNPKKEQKKYSVIKKANAFMEKQSVYELLEIYISGPTEEEIAKVNKITEDEIENSKNTLKITKAVYKCMIDAIDKLKDLLEESLAKM